MKCVIALLLSSAASTATAQPLGRLFHSELERAQLEQRRGQPAQPDPASRAVGTIRHDGLVVPSTGSMTWFINGHALDTHALSSLPAHPIGTALHLQGDTGHAVTLRPGEQAAVDPMGLATPLPDGIEVRQEHRAQAHR